MTAEKTRSPCLCWFEDFRNEFLIEFTTNLRQINKEFWISLWKISHRLFSIDRTVWFHFFIFVDNHQLYQLYIKLNWDMFHEWSVREALLAKFLDH